MSTPGKMWNDDVVGGDELRQRQANINRAMFDVMRDARRSNPNALAVPEKAVPQGSGWQPQRPLEMPPGQRLIEGLVNAALPHGGRRLELRASELAKAGLSEEVRAQLRA